MRILVAGGSGMLGRRVVEEAERQRHEVVAPAHDVWNIASRENTDYWLDTVVPDVLINCAGVLPVQAELDPEAAVVVNAAGPAVLARACEREAVRLLHVSTDCVFSGDLSGAPYWASSRPDPIDIYGTTKAGGEVASRFASPDMTLVVRTSFIGPEHGLWRWYLDNPEPRARAFLGASWNGSTVDVVSEALIDIAGLEAYWGREGGIVHLGTAAPTTKARVLQLLHEQFPFAPELDLVDHPVVNHWLAADYVLPELEARRIVALELEYQRARGS